MQKYKKYPLIPGFDEKKLKLFLSRLRGEDNAHTLTL